VKTFHKNFREQLARVIRLIRRSKRNIRPTLTPSGREFLRKAEEFVRKVRIKVRGDGDNEMSIAFPNGSRIVGLAGNEVTARGYSASLLLIDEAARVDDRFVSGDASVTGVANGDLWLMSTPPYGKRGFFWEEWEHGGEEWERICVSAPRNAHGFRRIAGRGERQRRRNVPAGVHV
jgi:hypothetical protein